MKLFKLSLLLTILFSFCAAAHAEVVGRVLMAAGDVSVIRDSRVLRVAVGSPVEGKDTLKTGPASNMQVRFTDESIVSLRDQSLLKIDEYQFTGKQDGMEKAFFNLVKGGFRTITGVIGRANKTNYGVKTATATIGIRGTNFALLLCTAGSCGAAAKDGVYGGVSGGIIAATNNTGEYQFGSGDYFYAPSQDTPVKKLIGPPGFFADQLAGQQHGGTRKASSTGTGNEQTQNGGAASDSSPNSVVQPPPQQAFIVTENLGPNGAPAVLSLSSVTPTSPVLPPAGINVLELAWATTSGVSGVSVSDTVQALQPQDTVTLSGSQMTSYCVTSTGCVTPFTFTDPGQKGSLNSGSVADQGNDPVGNMFWGRWVSGASTFVTDSSGNTFMPAPSVPYIFGALATSVPIANPVGATSVTFAFAGGPRPVDASGTVGTITSGGALSVDFLNRTVGLAPASSISLSVGALSYNMTTLVASYPSSTQISGTLSGTCTGGTACSAGAAATGPVSAHFTGATGAGLGIALATVITSPAPPVALAVGYRCLTC